MKPTEENQTPQEEALKEQEATVEAAAPEEETPQAETGEEQDAEGKMKQELEEARKTIEMQQDRYLRLSAEYDN